MLPAPFVVYTDFELVFKPVDSGVDTMQAVRAADGSGAACLIFQKIVSNVDPSFSRSHVI